MGIRYRPKPQDEIVEEKKETPKHLWDEKFEDTPDRLSMKSFLSLIASFGILMMFTGKNKINLSQVEDYSPQVMKHKKPLLKYARTKRIIRKVKTKPSQKTGPIAKNKILAGLFSGK